MFDQHQKKHCTRQMNDDNEERFLLLINARWLASETDAAADNT